MTEKLIFKSEISEIKKVREFFVKIAKDFLNVKDFYNFELVIGEVIANIIKYGSGNKIVDVAFEFSIDENIVFFKFEYEGSNITEEEAKKYIQLKKEEDIFELKESGRGTFLINRIMDKVEYFQNGKIAEIKLYKKII